MFGALAGAALANDHCECDRQGALDALSEAELIVSGFVQHARLSPGGDIAFTVKVKTALYGEGPMTLDLTTAGPERCGVPVFVGGGGVYALARSSPRVTPCQHTNVHHTQLPYLRDVVDMLQSDDPTLGRLLPRLERRWASMTPNQLQWFFNLARQLSPMDEPNEGDGEWVYRRVRVRLTGQGAYRSTEVLR